MHLVNIPIHNLAAGNMQLLQSSRNTSGLEMSHLRSNLKLKKGARHLLLGRNGCGKTTLLRAIASGKLDGWPQDLRVHLVDQEEPVDLQCSALDIVLAADSELLELNREKAELESRTDEAAGVRLCEIYALEEELGDGQRWTNACKILVGLGFDDASMNTTMAQLSGGWRMRCMLAAGLFMKPELLLLDEPTNHLDITAIHWLQNHLVGEFRGTVLCVSHDHAFVNALANEIIVFTEEHSLEYFTGNLQDLHKHASKMERQCKNDDAARQKRLDQLQKTEEKTKQQVQNMAGRLGSNMDNNSGGYYNRDGMSNIEQFAARAKKKRERVEQRQRPSTVDPVTLQTIEEVDFSWAAALAPKFHSADLALKFAFKEAEPLDLPRDTPMLAASNVSYRYNNAEKDILTNVDLKVFEKCRIAFAGKNGAGKSTLVKILTGEVVPSSGKITRNPDLRIAYFGQHDAEKLQELNITPVQYMAECFPKVREHELCAQLSAFGVSDKMMHCPMGMLSGGHRMRVAFARLCAEEPHLLIMDEPTNHLDIYTIESLCDALKDFQGGVIFVTHNTYLLEAVADSMVVVGGSSTRMEKASLVNKKRFNHDTS